MTLLRSKQDDQYAIDAIAYGDCLEPNENAAGINRHAKNAMSAQIAASMLDTALSSGDVSSFMLFLKEVVKARGGFTATARKTGLNRTALYKIVSPHGNPSLSTLIALLSVVGLRLSVKPLGGLQAGKANSAESDQLKDNG